SWIVGTGHVRRDRGPERLSEVDGFALEGVGRVRRDEAENVRAVVRVGDGRRVLPHRRIGGWEEAPVDLGVGQQLVVEQVHGAHVAVVALLQHFALEELRLAAEEEEALADRIAEGSDAPATLEVRPETVAIDAKAGLWEQPLVALTTGGVQGGRIRIVGER